MSTGQIATNKVTLSRLHDALDSGDEPPVASTIDQPGQFG